MSDGDLSRELQKLGLAHLMNSPTNFQADVKKQDSSHSAPLLLAFLWICVRAGCDAKVMNWYFEYCVRYSFASRGADGVRASVSFNLGSGDPFTLIRNNIMEMCVIACRYYHAKTMVIVEKGDDVHGWMIDQTSHPLARLPSVSLPRLGLVVSVGEVGYHAGRFHNGTRYLVDPVRAFLKHFTRLSDSNVSDQELYRSYCSRATDYSESEVSFLLAACQQHYPYYDGDVIATMISTMLKLRDHDSFMEFSKVQVKPHSVSVDTSRNCVENCLRAMYPNRPKQWRAQFRSRTSCELKAMFEMHGVPFVYVNSPYGQMSSGVIYFSDTHARVRVPVGGI